MCKGKLYNMRKRRAFTLVELIVAMGVGAVIIASATYMFGMVNNYYSEHRKDAYADTIAQELSESIAARVGKAEQVQFINYNAATGSYINRYPIGIANQTQVSALLIARTDAVNSASGTGDGAFRIYDFGVVPDSAVTHSSDINSNIDTYNITTIATAVQAARGTTMLYNEAFYNNASYEYSFAYSNGLTHSITLTEATFRANPGEAYSTGTQVAVNAARSFAFQLLNNDATVSGLDAPLNGNILILYTNRKPKDDFDSKNVAWEPNESYTDGDIVYWEGKPYEAKTTHSGKTTNPKSDTTNWKEVQFPLSSASPSSITIALSAIIDDDNATAGTQLGLAELGLEYSGTTISVNDIQYSGSHTINGVGTYEFTVVPTPDVGSLVYNGSKKVSINVVAEMVDISTFSVTPATLEVVKGTLVQYPSGGYKLDGTYNNAPKDYENLTPSNPSNEGGIEVTQNGIEGSQPTRHIDVTFIGNGATTGSVSKTYREGIDLVFTNKFPLSSAIASLSLNNTSFAYKGAAYTSGDITVTANLQSTLPAGVTLTTEAEILGACDVTYGSNGNVGTQTVTVTALSSNPDYAGSVSTTYTITPKTLTAASFSASTGTFSYDTTSDTWGSKPTFTLASGISGETLSEGADYTIVYSVGSYAIDNDAIGTGSKTVTATVNLKNPSNYVAAGAISTTFTADITKPASGEPYTLGNHLNCSQGKLLTINGTTYIAITGINQTIYSLPRNDLVKKIKSATLGTTVSFDTTYPEVLLINGHYYSFSETGDVELTSIVSTSKILTYTQFSSVKELAPLK